MTGIQNDIPPSLNAAPFLAENSAQTDSSFSEGSGLLVRLLLISSELITVKRPPSLRANVDLPEWEGPQRTTISLASRRAHLSVFGLRVFVIVNHLRISLSAGS